MPGLFTQCGVSDSQHVAFVRNVVSCTCPFYGLAAVFVHSLLMATWILSSLWLLRICEHRLCVDMCFIFSGVDTLD